MVTTAEFIGIVGGIAGLLSLGIIILKEIRKKPKLICDVTNSYFYLPTRTEDHFIGFSIDLKIHNLGNRTTTIHKAKLSFDYQGKHFQPSMSGQLDVLMTPDRTEQKSIQFNHNRRTDGEIKDKVQNCELIIEHTHGTKTISIPEMKQI